MSSCALADDPDRPPHALTMRVLDTDGREVRRRTRARHAGKHPAVVAIRERKGNKSVPAVFRSHPGPWRGRRVSIFRWLSQCADVLMRNCLTFGWRSRHSRSEDPQDWEDMSCKIPYGIEENL